MKLEHKDILSKKCPCDCQLACGIQERQNDPLKIEYQALSTLITYCRRNAIHATGGRVDMGDPQ